MAPADSGTNTNAGLSTAKRALLLRKLQQRNTIASGNHTIARRAERLKAPLSYVQQQMWFLDQLSPGDIMNNRPAAIRVRGALDQKRLQRSLQAIVSRHEVLRTTFPSADGIPFQAIHAPSDVLVTHLDMSADPAHTRDKRAQERMLSEAQKTFDLASGPLLRIFLLKLSPYEHIVLLCTHHIVFDGWSERIFWQEMAANYDALASGTTSAMPELVIQYGDYAQWQQNRLQSPSKMVLLKYWRQQIGGLRMLDLPADRPRPTHLTHVGAHENLILHQALGVRLRELSRHCEATLFMTLLAAFQALLGRYSNQNDIAVGTPVAGRQRLELEPLIGIFINTLVLRAKINARRSFRDLLAQVRVVTLDAFSHQEMPFGLLIEDFKMARDSSRSPLFQVLFQLRNLPNEPVKVAGLRMENERIDLHTSKVDLALDVSDLPDGLHCKFEYNTDLFNADTIRTFAEYYEQLLLDLVAQPDVPMDHLGSWRQIAPPSATVSMHESSACVTQHAGIDQVSANGEPRTTSRNECFPKVFEARVKSLPDHPAVVGEDGALSYSQLNHRANVLARRLQALGLRSGAPVVLCVERSIDMVTAIIGILKAGGAYVPLDPSYPKARLQWMLSDSGAAVLVTHRQLLEKLAAVDIKVVLLDGEPAPNGGEDSANLATPPLSCDIAYIIYTSGSTGTPKGVMVPHRALMHFVEGAQQLYGLSAADHVLQFASISFDGSVEEIFCALAAGATLFLRTDAMLDSMRALLDGCAQWHISFLGLTTAYWHQLAASIATEGLQLPASVRLIAVGGEKINRTVVRTWFDHVSGPVRLINSYGPTEATVVCTAYEITPSDAADPMPEIPIGRPLGNTQVYILNDSGKPAPIGEAGELYIGGNGVASGYLNRRELTEARFVADRFSAEPGARLYRTGDSVRFRNDGEIEFLGRLDDQMKVRGFRIEPGEVEAVLLRYPEVRAAAVAARENRLVAYLVAGERGILEVSVLRRKIQEMLPDYMVPSVYVQLEDLPLTTSGKMDRNKLLALPGKRLEATDESQAPRTKLEKQLTGIWRKVLGLMRVGVQNNFFELGGHSLLATQVMSRVRSTFGVVVPLRLFFKNPTIEGLAREIEAASVEGIAPHFHADADGGQKDNASSPAGLIIQASFAQQRLWFLDQINPGQAAYIIDYALNITGPLDVTVLEQAVNEILRRHDSLRTTIAMRNGGPVQVVAESLTMRLPTIDISDEPPTVREAKARTLAAEISNQPFDLAQGPLLRLGLIRLGLEDHVLAIPIHHIVADGWSLDILQKELAVLYGAFCRGEPSPLAELPIQYRDFTVSQREQMQNGLMQRQLAYWKRQLKDLTPLELPTARPHSSKVYIRGAQCKKVLAAEVARGITKLGNRNGATLFMTVLAAFQLMLHRLCGQDDITVGTPVAGRTHTDSESLIGLFVNNLVLRTDLSGNPSFRELLLRVKETTLAALEHQDVPFERLVQELRPARDLGRNPLFDVMINYLSNADTSISRGGLTYQPIELEKTTARFALTLYISEEDDGRLGLRWMYQSDLFEATSIECMADQLTTLLIQIVDAPESPLDSYSLVTESTRYLLPDPALPLTESISEPVTSMFLNWARRTPIQTALRQGNRQWRYEELAEDALSLASSLSAWGVSKGDVVGISGVRSFGFVAASLALLLAGGVMVPVDPTLPPLRRRLMLETAQVRLLLWIGKPGSDEYREYQQSGLRVYCLDPDGGWSSQPLAPDNRLTLPELRPEDPAYIFFTSGTSGVPSGVLGWHKGISHFVNWQRETFAIRPRDRIAQLTSFSFDVLLRDLFLPLTSGATLCLPEENDLFQVPKWLDRMGITVLHTVPTLVQVWLKDAALPNGLPELRWVFIAGEPLTSALVKQWREAFPDAGRVVNLYGPTETTMVKCFYEVPEIPEAGVQPAGEPLPETQILIMGPGGSLCGVNEPGEIAVRTPYRTLGYLDPDDRVRAGFTMNPFRDDVHDLIYYTGDRGRYRPDGLLEILGRLDDQVKIRGVRVEPAEVSSVLAQHPLVQSCTVVSPVDKSKPSERYLAAYVVPTEPNAVGMETLRGYLSERLPAAMLPAAFAFLDSLPVTNRGKVDHKALPVLDPHTFESVRPRIAPRTALELALARIWCDILKCSGISIHDDFFLLGGHSLMVTQMVARMRSQFRIDLPIRAIFEAPTIARLAALIEPLKPVLADAQPTGIPRIPRTGRSPGTNTMGIDRMKT